MSAEVYFECDVCEGYHLHGESCEWHDFLMEHDDEYRAARDRRQQTAHERRVFAEQAQLAMLAQLNAAAEQRTGIQLQQLGNQTGPLAGVGGLGGLGGILGGLW